MTPKAYTLIGFALAAILLTLFIIYAARKQQQTVRSTQEKLSDRDLLRKLSAQPDGFLSPHRLSEITSLSLSEARLRLSTLSTAGLIAAGYNARGRNYFRLCTPLIEIPPLDLSSDPFLTVEDILKIFGAYKFKLTEQDLILATGLPLALIRRELNHFEKQQVLETVYTSNPTGTASQQRTYVLKEPYRSQPDAFLEQADAMDREVRTILRNDNYIV